MSAQAPIKIKGFKKPASEDASIKLSNKRKAAGEVEKEEGENGKKAKESHAPKVRAAAAHARVASDQVDPAR